MSTFAKINRTGTFNALSSSHSTEKIDRLVGDNEWMEYTSYLDEDFIRQYLDFIAQYPILSAEQEKILFEKVINHGDQESKEIFVRHNLKLVVWIARKLRPRAQQKSKRAISIMDLIQAGNLGLLRAMKDFDPSQGKFSTYAVWWIKQKIARFIDDSDLVRIPVHRNENLRKLAEAKRELTSKGKSVTVANLAELTELDKKQILILEDLAAQRVFSVDKPLRGEEDNTLVNILPDISQHSIHDVMDRDAFEHKVRIRLKFLLTIKEFEILRMRWGLGRTEEYTLKEVGEVYGVTRERIRQLQKVAEEKLANDPMLMELFLGINPYSSVVRKKVKEKRLASQSQLLFCKLSGGGVTIIKWWFEKITKKEPIFIPALFYFPKNSLIKNRHMGDVKLFHPAIAAMSQNGNPYPFIVVGMGNRKHR